MDIFEIIDNVEIRFVIALVIIVFLLVRYVVVKIKQRNNHSE
jgi:heme/copper-type cytochrome/quinol oxidase subunit 2